MQSLSHFEKLFFGESVNEQSENVVDHIIRRILLYPNDVANKTLISDVSTSSKFNYSWADTQFLNNIYNDKTLPQIVEKIYVTVLPQCFKTTTSISQRITLTKTPNDHEYELVAWSHYVNLLSNIQKKMPFKEKEMFVWSFCVIIATKIKYLELSASLTTKEGAKYKYTSFYEDRQFHFRSFQGLIQKFVLELSESSASRSLWPWYDNLLNDTHEELKEMDTILCYNGEYILNRKKAARYEELTPYSWKQFTYPNIRYIRKCAANLLLDERLTAKQLFEIHKITLPASNATASSVPLPPTSSRLHILAQSLSVPFDSLNDELEDVLTDEEKTSFKSVIKTILQDSMDDPQSIELRKMLESGISKREKQKEQINEEKEAKELNDEAFVAFRSYFTKLPNEFKRDEKKKERISNKYDVLLLRLGIEYGFDLKRIKKLLYHYKKYVNWEFRQFFRQKLRVLIRMKYLCSLVLSNLPKSHFYQSVTASRSVIFCDADQWHQHMKYCARFEKYDFYRSAQSVLTAIEPEKKRESKEIELIDVMKSPKVRFEELERGATIIIKHLDDVLTPPDISDVNIQAKSMDSNDESTQRFSVHRKRSSFDIGENKQYEAISSSVVAARDIQQELRDSMHFYEVYELQDDMIRYIVQKIRSKTDRRVIESLWKILIIMLSQLPLPNALGSISRHWDIIRNKQTSNVKFIQRMVETLIRVNTFPIATALFLSAWLEERALDDITRRDAWLSMAAECEAIAQKEVEDINSDHVLCLLLYAPTEIHLMSTLNIAIRYNRIKFLNHPYITGVLTSMWCNGNPMMADPLIISSLFGQKSGELIKALWFNPTQFVYSAFGLAVLHGVLFLIVLVLITHYATVNHCENLNLETGTPLLLYEYIVVSIVFSLIGTEVAEFRRDSRVYLTKISNLFDFIMCLIWLCICLMKAYSWSHVCSYIETYSLCIDGNDTILNVYYALWGIVMIFMYMKICAIFQFTTLMGRFLKIGSMLLNDIGTFLVTASVFFLGFTFCLYIIGAGANTGTQLDTLSGTAFVLYRTFFTLAGPYEQIEDIDNTSLRYWITSLLIVYQIIAAILLLNLLIAMMSDTYSNVFAQATAETNFYKIEQTTACVQPYGRLIGFFSLVTLVISWIFHYVVIILQLLFYLCTGSRWLFDVNRFETFCWIYTDICTMDLLCCCCARASETVERLSSHHGGQESRVGDHGYTQSEARLSLMEDDTEDHKEHLLASKLYSISKNAIKSLLIDRDYKLSKRDRCCFCCVKRRKISQPLSQQMTHSSNLRTRSRTERKTMLLSLHADNAPVTPMSVKVKEESNLLYEEDAHSSSSSSSDLNEKSYLMANRPYAIVSQHEEHTSRGLTKYETQNKAMCRMKLERNRRLNKVRNTFMKQQAKQKQSGIMWSLSEWYNNWEFVDNETFCPNCFIGPPMKSIEEYGTVDGFINAVQKRFEYVIKRSDRMALRRQLKDSILCQRCFFPLHCNTFHDDRKSRFGILVEIISTYLFYIFAWIPMIIVMIPFACIGTIRDKSMKYGSAQSLLWKIEERKNFYDTHGVLLPNNKQQIDRSPQLYHNALNVSFDSDSD